MIHKPNLPSQLTVPYKFIHLINEFNMFKISDEYLNKIRKSFKGFETYDDNKSIITYYFKPFNSQDTEIVVKGFDVVVDFDTLLTEHCLEIKNLDQFASDLNSFLHFDYDVKLNPIGKEIEFLLCNFLCKVFIYKTLGNYITKTTGIPVVKTKTDLSFIDMDETMAVDIDQVFLMTDDELPSVPDNW